MASICENESEYRRGCRCDVCRVAHKARHAASRKAWRQRPSAEVPHGRSGYTNWGCRCEVCSEAHASYRVGEWDESRTGRPYTEDDLALVVREDLTVPEIARALRRSYRSVVLKRYYLRRSA